MNEAEYVWRIMEIEGGVIRRGRTQLNLIPRSSRLTVP